MPGNSGARRHAADRDEAPAYIRDNFDASDRLAVVLCNRRTRDVIQRIAPAQKIAETDFQAWLQAQNTKGYEIYISMNALAKTARGRTKADIETIRHLYLDFDHQGTAAVEKLLALEDLPKPNYLLNTSLDKWQAIWKVHGFGKEEAEHLQRALVQELGADPAATDCARVLRLPGFHNHKYSEPFRVASQIYSQETYGPDRFPRFAAGGKSTHERLNQAPGSSRKQTPGENSQSERDWAYAKRALARGEPQDVIISAIANHRRYEKYDPHYYAELTVRKAAAALAAERGTMLGKGQPDR